jgi:two-component system OmpR family sensor kinase
MVETAAAIAAGDLSRRVPDSDSETELGRLGSALNEMLSQIEAGIQEREAGEARLRRFAADAAHELRTPLTVLSGTSELLLRNMVGQLSDDQRTLIESMRRFGIWTSRVRRPPAAFRTGPDGAAMAHLAFIPT